MRPPLRLQTTPGNFGKALDAYLKKGKAP